ncbi:MAG: MerR family transcriptional regulator [Demequinaceae bacterium]|nr:MerR family transcriptional regulator [Demequinaceae bacterium]
MAEPAPRESLGAASARKGHWPHQLSHQPTLRVGDVLGALAHDFPSLTTSKVRFLDSQGLVIPQRTAAGYRLYSPADVERLRYVLRQQRDAYAPLSVIRDRLERLDSGTAHEALSLAAVGFERSDVVSIEEAARLTGTTADMIALLVAEGIVEQSAPGRFDRSDVTLVGACVHYLVAGADVRELRALARVAQREVEAAEALAAPLKRQDNVSDAASSRHARLDAAADVFTAFVRRAEVTRP